MAIPEDGRGKRRRFFPRSMADLPLLVVLYLVIAEFAMGKRSRTGTVGTFRIFNGLNSRGWAFGPHGFQLR